MTQVDSSTYEVRLFDPRGRPLRDLRGIAPLYSWTLNDVGDCQFDMSTSDPAFSEENIQFGNWVVINHSHLPPWVGFIDSENSRTWTSGKVSVYALSAEKIFDYRFIRPYELRGYAGEVFAYLIDRMNKENSLGHSIPFEIGEVMRGGRGIYYPLLANSGAVVRWITRAAKAEWNITPAYSGGNLVLRCNLWQSKGTDTQISLNYTNSQLTEGVLTEDGLIYNYVLFFTSPQSGGRELIVGNPQKDDVSISRYGLRMHIGEMSAEDLATLDYAAWRMMVNHSYPRRHATPSLLNVDSLWRHLDIGNSFNWENHLVGFSGGQLGAMERARLVGLEVDLRATTANAIVDLYSNNQNWRELYLERW